LDCSGSGSIVDPSRHHCSLAARWSWASLVAWKIDARPLALRLAIAYSAR
jgi:hypothetical protein